MKNDYDVFISFKNTEDDKDRKIAYKVYEYLTENGLKVFFSDVTLAENGTDNWQNTIDESIEKSKIFIAVGTNKDYMELKHPQVERTSFLTLKRKDKKKYIYSYIGGAMTTNDLPSELRNIQCFHDKNKNDLDNLLTYVVNSLNKTSPKKSKLKSTDISLDEKSSDIMFNLDDFIKNKTFEMPNDHIEVEEENIFDKILAVFIVIVLFGNLAFLFIYSFEYLVTFLLFNLFTWLFYIIFNIEKFISLFVLIQILTFIGGVSYYFLI